MEPAPLFIEPEISITNAEDNTLGGIIGGHITEIIFLGMLFSLMIKSLIFGLILLPELSNAKNFA